MITTDPNPFSFDEPQRQAVSGILVESVFLVQKIIKAFWGLVLVLALKADEIAWPYFVLILLCVLLIVLTGGYLSYRNTNFRIDKQHHEFILQKGILNKKQVVLQLAKIQQVNINQNFIQKLINVYGVEIETAGTSKSEVNIGAVSKPVAIALKSQLTSDSSNPAPAINPEEDQNVSSYTAQSFVKIGLPSLVKMGLTSRYIESFFLLLAFLSAIYNNVKDIWWNDDESESQFQQLIGSLLGFQAIIFLIITLFVITVIYNLIRTLLSFYDLTITKSGSSLNISYGLFNSKSTIIHPQKVQKISFLQNYLQKKMDLYELCIQQPSSDVHTDKKAKIQMPGCNSHELQGIIKFVLNKDIVKGKILRPNIRKVMGSIAFLVLIPLAVIAIIMINTSIPMMVFYIAPFYLFLVGVIIYFSYRHYRLYINDDFIIKQSGIWDIKTEIIEPYKIQAVSLKQKIWHKRSNIAHITLHTAGGDLSFRFADYTELKKYTDVLTYQIETSRKNWM